MRIHWTETVGEDWSEIRAELDRAFQMSRAAAMEEESFVYVVHHDDLLGRKTQRHEQATDALGVLSLFPELDRHLKLLRSNHMAFE